MCLIVQGVITIAIAVANANAMHHQVLISRLDIMVSH
jgi:hypothetical protein